MPTIKATTFEIVGKLYCEQSSTFELHPQSISIHSVHFGPAPLSLTFV